MASQDWRELSTKPSAEADGEGFGQTHFRLSPFRLLESSTPNWNSSPGSQVENFLY